MENFYLVNKTYANDIYEIEGDISWDTVYKEVLCYYAAIFPAMNAYNIFFQIEENIITMADAILLRVSKPYEATTLFMPITRTMTPGKRKLLVKYLEQELDKRKQPAFR